MSTGEAGGGVGILRRAIELDGKLRFNIGVINLLIATRNDHKVGEIQSLLGAKFKCLTLKDHGNPPDIQEDVDTFIGNALKKAREIASWRAGLAGELPQFVLADDSGLEVDALNGAPGVHSARFAALDSGRKGNSADAENNAKLLRLLQNVPTEKRGARFRCAIAVVPLTNSGERTGWLFEGVCEGRIELHARGSGGFGYDPLFVPTGYDVSFAELGDTIKNQISHRAKALEKLRLAWVHQHT